MEESGTSTLALARRRGAVSARAALRVRGLSVTFATQRGDLAAVDVDLDVDRGELVALLGESGSGKSVTARAVMGLNPGSARVTARELRVGDHDLLALGEEERRRLRGSSVSLVLHDALSALNPVLSVGDQVAELFRVHRGLSRRDAHRRVVDRARRGRLSPRIVLAGDPPSPTDPPSGCRFHPRCRLARERCGTDQPDLRTLPSENDRVVVCHYAEQALERLGEIA
jgi:oligopeptide/dipeptide ABC transporter ATP-binding protein